LARFDPVFDDKWGAFDEDDDCYVGRVGSFGRILTACCFGARAAWLA
jgi:hypothetical protein